MSIFDNFSSSTNMEETKDSLGGYQPLESNIYSALIKTVYITKSQKGALAANIVADIDGREYREQIWISNAQGQNFFISKQTGNKVPLPGFTIVNDICKSAIGKELKELNVEPRVFKIYDYETKSEKPTEVPTIIDLLNTRVALGILFETVDKMSKNDEGKYVPNGDTRDQNVIDKAFNDETHLTPNEAKTGETEAKFYDKWLKKNKGKIINKVKGTKSEGKSGAPKKPNPEAAGSLFS